MLYGAGAQRAANGRFPSRDWDLSAVAAKYSMDGWRLVVAAAISNYLAGIQSRRFD